MIEAVSRVEEAGALRLWEAIDAALLGGARLACGRW